MKGSLISFKSVFNTRGYPATGQVIEKKDGTVTAEVWGLTGPGSVDIIHDIPIDEIKVEKTRLLDDGDSKPPKA
jgi:hypothetical protein